MESIWLIEHTSSLCLGQCRSDRLKLVCSCDYDSVIKFKTKEKAQQFIDECKTLEKIKDKLAPVEHGYYWGEHGLSK